MYYLTLEVAQVSSGNATLRLRRSTGNVFRTMSVERVRGNDRGTGWAIWTAPQVHEAQTRPEEKTTEEDQRKENQACLDCQTSRAESIKATFTGVDARPWHGAKARVIGGRTPAQFERLLRSAKTFAGQHKIPRVILGPLNEWGEGSYIEPCAEFGFEMIEQIRSVFGTGDPKSWPVNIGPAEVGLGPYAYGPANESAQ